MRSRNKLVCGVGVNDADYECVKERCPFYIKWKSMLERVYTKQQLEKRPSYRKCSIVADWHVFSNFKAWMEKQDWQGKHLDKDLIGDGTLYSPDTCVFVSQDVNSFMNEHGLANGLWPVGVSKRERSKVRKFEAHCNIIKEGKRSKKFLGSFLTPNEAHQAWKREKYNQAVILAATINNERIASALVKRYTI